MRQEIIRPHLRSYLKSQSSEDPPRLCADHIRPRDAGSDLDRLLNGEPRPIHSDGVLLDRLRGCAPESALDHPSAKPNAMPADRELLALLRHHLLQLHLLRTERQGRQAVQFAPGATLDLWEVDRMRSTNHLPEISLFSPRRRNTHEERARTELIDRSQIFQRFFCTPSWSFALSGRRAPRKSLRSLPIFSPPTCLAARMDQNWKEPIEGDLANQRPSVNLRRISGKSPGCLRDASGLRRGLVRQLAKFSFSLCDLPLRRSPVVVSGISPASLRHLSGSIT